MAGRQAGSRDSKCGGAGRDMERVAGFIREGSEWPT